MVFNQVSFQAKLLRRAFRRFDRRRRFPNTLMSTMPIMFANSFPKSGTHLLTQVLAAFSELGLVVNSDLPPILTYHGPTGQVRPIRKILQEIDRLHPGDVGYGHLHALPKIITATCRPGLAPYFIYRDPRDVVVSHVYYLTKLAPKHVHHHYYKHELSDIDQRLRTSILGRPEIDINFPDIRARFEPYLTWLDIPEALSMRFEDLITQPQLTIARIFDHAVMRGFVSSLTREAALELLAAGINPKRSTFRTGKVGGWRAKFNTQHKDLFKQATGDLLIHLGYETNNDW